jgi:hypothetical protein
VTWTVVLVEEVDEWFVALGDDTASLVADAIDQLEERGPALPRPLADLVKGSRLHNMKELRPGSAGASEVRILFCFDPERQAVLLVAGDKSGQWRDWYKRAIRWPRSGTPAGSPASTPRRGREGRGEGP